MTPETLVLIISGFFSAITAMVIAYVNRQNSSLREQFDALAGLVDRLHKENDELFEEIKEVKAENGQLKAWAELLVGQLKDNGIKPHPMPDREKTRPIPRRA